MEHIYLTDKKTEVLAEAAGGYPGITRHQFGKGSGIYMTGFAFSEESTRLLLQLILELDGKNRQNALQIICMWNVPIIQTHKN